MSGAVLRDLCDEALTFQHDQTLLGFSLDNPDEPADDDFETRCRAQNADCFIPIDQVADNHGVDSDEADVSDGDEDDTAYDPVTAEINPDSLGARLEQYSIAQIDRVVDHLVLMLSIALGCNPLAVSRSIVLDACERNLSFSVLKVVVQDALYVADRDDEYWGAQIKEPDYMPSHSGGHSRSNTAERASENKQEAMEYEIRMSTGWKSKCRTKNASRQTCLRRLRRASIRRNADHFFVNVEQELDDARQMYAELVAKEMRDEEPSFDSWIWVGESLDFDDTDSGDDCDEDTACDFSDIDWGDDYDEEPVETDTERMERLYGFSFSREDDEEADIFAGYGEDDSSVDSVIPPSSSRVRVTGRYSRLSRREALVLANGVVAEFTRRPTVTSPLWYTRR